MKTPNITHNNHYVPQFYLKNWSTNEKTIYTYSLLVSNSKVPYWRNESIRSAAVWYDLYTRNIAQQEVNDFETWFDHEFESPVKPVFDKLLCGEQITKCDRIIISRFVAAQHMRTPASLNRILEFERTEFPKAIEDTLQKLNRKLSSGNTHALNKVPPVQNDLIPLKVTFDKEKSFVKAEAIVGKSTYLFAVKHLLTETIKHMYGHRWSIIHAADGISFPTSDDPVICLNYRSENDYDFDGGWGLKNGNIIMQISPKMLLFTQIGDKNSYNFLDNSLHWSSFFRKIIIQHAYRSVFADKPQKGILEINPRIVNKNLYDKEKNIVASWHQEHMLAEKQLLDD